jgi:hypothetical protein
MNLIKNLFLAMKYLLFSNKIYITNLCKIDLKPTSLE